jgi:hypothetical protein
VLTVTLLRLAWLAETLMLASVLTPEAPFAGVIARREAGLGGAAALPPPGCAFDAGLADPEQAAANRHSPADMAVIVSPVRRAPELLSRASRAARPRGRRTASSLSRTLVLRY